MRTRILIAASAAVAALAAGSLTACDQTVAPTLAGLGGSAATTGADTNNTPALLVSPAQLQLAVGATFQLGTNAPVSLQSQVRWTSLQPTIATVSASGLVSALAPGTATIVARFESDSTRVATATINVVGATTTGGGTTGGANPGAP